MGKHAGHPAEFNPYAHQPPSPMAYASYTNPAINQMYQGQQPVSPSRSASPDARFLQNMSPNYYGYPQQPGGNPAYIQQVGTWMPYYASPNGSGYPTGTQAPPSYQAPAYRYPQQV